MAALGQTAIAPVASGEWVPPRSAYFQDADVRGLGDVPRPTVRWGESATADALGWLGAKEHASIEHLNRTVHQIEEAADRARGATLFESLVHHPYVVEWLSEGRLDALKQRAWLPIDDVGMSRPAMAFPIFQSYLFESQRRLLSIPRHVQTAAASANLIMALEIPTRIPAPVVVRHLLACSETGKEVSSEVYQRLSEANVSLQDLLPLRAAACIQVEAGVYLTPQEVFWAEAPFGPYARRLEPDLRRHSRFFELVGVKETPDSDNALRVLERIATELGHDVIGNEDRDVVHACWVIIEGALHHRQADASWLASHLSDLRSIPSPSGVLERPNRLVFRDATGRGERFALLRDHLVDRHAATARAQEAAGVQNVESILQSVVTDLQSATRDDVVESRVNARLNGILRSALAASLSPMDVENALSDLSYRTATSLSTCPHVAPFRP